jgi:hypothetical protein
MTKMLLKILGKSSFLLRLCIEELRDGRMKVFDPKETGFCTSFRRSGTISIAVKFDI